jgi:hypothetical protein
LIKFDLLFFIAQRTFFSKRVFVSLLKQRRKGLWLGSLKLINEGSGAFLLPSFLDKRKGERRGTKKLKNKNNGPPTPAAGRRWWW